MRKNIKKSKFKMINNLYLLAQYFISNLQQNFLKFGPSY